jgi:hypothetical protein
MTDNFKLYKDFIAERFAKTTLLTTDSYFVVELMRRGKDNPDMPAANYHFKNYYIRKPEDLDKYENEIKTLCEVLRLRAYASVNIKSFKQVSLDTMAELARRIANNDYKKNYAVLESCSGSYCYSNDKTWVIDLDDCKMDDKKVKKVYEILDRTKTYHTEKVIAQFPTKSGVHLITKPFDVREFDLLYSGCFNDETVDIKKNHLTLLYENL